MGCLAYFLLSLCSCAGCLALVLGSEAVVALLGRLAYFLLSLCSCAGCFGEFSLIFFTPASCTTAQLSPYTEYAAQTWAPPRHGSQSFASLSTRAARAPPAGPPAGELANAGASARLAISTDLGHRRGSRRALIAAAEHVDVHNVGGARPVRAARPHRGASSERSCATPTCSITARASRRRGRRSRDRS